MRMEKGDGALITIAGLVAAFANPLLGQDTAGGFIGSVALAGIGIKAGLELVNLADKRFPSLTTDKKGLPTFPSAVAPLVIAFGMGAADDFAGDTIENYLTREQEGGIKVLQIETAPSALPASVIVPA